MTALPTFQLSRLREIGWAKWDPIGVGGPDHGWPADEYDGYLLQAAVRLWHGQSDQEIAEYLTTVETDHMGLSDSPDTLSRAADVAASIREYVETLRA